MSTELYIPAPDGVELYLKKDILEDSKAAILIVHGLCEHLGRYDYVTDALMEEGFSVYRFDHRGHGKSKGQRVYFAGYDQIADDVNHVLDLTLKENPDKPVFLFGHSMGGLAVSLFGTKYPGKVRGILTSGAWTRYNIATAGELPVKDVPLDTYVPNALGDSVCSDPAVVEAYLNDPLVEKEISIGLLNTVRAGMLWQQQNAVRFTDPVLVLHGNGDGIVSPTDSWEFYNEIGSENKTLKIYARLLHEILNEPERDEVIADMVRWMDKHMYSDRT